MAPRTLRVETGGLLTAMGGSSHQVFCEQSEIAFNR